MQPDGAACANGMTIVSAAENLASLLVLTSKESSLENHNFCNLYPQTQPHVRIKCHPF